MSVVLTQDMPGLTRDWIEQVTAEMHFEETGTPHGLIVHTACEIPGGIRIVDVWETEEDYRRFGDTQLREAVEKVTAARGTDPMTGNPPPDAQVIPAFDIVLP